MRELHGLGFLISFIFIGCSVVPSKEENYKYKGYESAPYAVINKTGNIDTRLYEPSLMAQVEVTGKREQAINDGFRMLAGYIFGNNISQEKIAMTTPVIQKPTSEKIAMTTPVVQMGNADRWKVQFMMPAKYTLENLPKAKDERIQFRMSPSVKMVVIRFSGVINENNLNQNLEKLEEFVKQNNLNIQRPHQYAFYDAPWTLPFMRRNEIAFILN